MKILNKTIKYYMLIGMHVLFPVGNTELTEDDIFNQFVGTLEGQSGRYLKQDDEAPNAEAFLKYFAEHLQLLEPIDESKAKEYILEKFAARKCAIKVINKNGTRVKVVPGLGWHYDKSKQTRRITAARKCAVKAINKDRVRAKVVPGLGWHYDKSKQTRRITGFILQPKNAMSFYTLGGNPVEEIFFNSLKPIEKQSNCSVQVVFAPDGDNFFEADPNYSFLKDIDMNVDLQSDAAVRAFEADLNKIMETNLKFDPFRNIMIKPENIPDYYWFKFKVITLGQVNWTIENIEDMKKLLSKIPEDPKYLSLRNMLQQDIKWLGDLYSLNSPFSLLRMIRFYESSVGEETMNTITKSAEILPELKKLLNKP